MMWSGPCRHFPHGSHWLPWDCRAARGSSIQLFLSCQVSPPRRKRDLFSRSFSRRHRRDWMARSGSHAYNWCWDWSSCHLYSRDWDRERGDPKRKERLCDQSVEGMLVSLTTGKAALLHWVPSLLKEDLFSYIIRPTRSTSLHYKPSILIFFFLWKLLIKIVLFSWNIAKVIQEK